MQRVKQNRVFQEFFACLFGGVLALQPQMVADTQSASAHDTCVGMAEYNRIRSEWVRFITEDQSSSRRVYLLAKGEAALEVMLDLLYGPRRATTQNEEVEAIVNDLGAAEFGDREAAQRQLESMGYAVVGILEKYTQDDDPEIAMRVRDILSEAKDLAPNPKLRQSALAPCTEILDTSWPIDEIRNVVKRNLKRLSRVESVEYRWDVRPLGPLLGSLRHSEAAADRELLAEFAQSAADGAAEVALWLMRNGLRGRTRHNMAPHWEDLPEHDYSRVPLLLLDCSRPAVFKEAMYSAPRGQRLRSILHDALPKVKDAKLREEILSFLWHFMRDPVALDHFFKDLGSPDDSVFSTAVHRLTNSAFQYKGAKIIPKLRPALRGENEKRRKLVLARLDNYKGEISVALAAAEAAPFLASENPEERKIARKVLLHLQDSGGGNVLHQLSHEHESGEVRTQAKKLHQEWKESKKEKQR